MSPQPSAGVHDAPSDGLSSIRMAALVPWASYTHAQAPAGCPGDQDQIDRLGNRLAADSQLSKQLGPDLIKAQQAHLVADSAFFGRTGSLTSFSTDVLSLATDYGGDTGDVSQLDRVQVGRTTVSFDSLTPSIPRMRSPMRPSFRLTSPSVRFGPRSSPKRDQSTSSFWGCDSSTVDSSRADNLASTCGAAWSWSDSTAPLMASRWTWARCLPVRGTGPIERSVPPQGLRQVRTQQRQIFPAASSRYRRPSPHTPHVFAITTRCCRSSRSRVVRPASPGQRARPSQLGVAAPVPSVRPASLRRNVARCRASSDWRVDA